MAGPTKQALLSGRRLWRLLFPSALAIAAWCCCHSPALLADKPAPADQGVTIVGRVVDADGAPVAGAQINLYREQRLGYGWSNDVVCGQAITDGAGEYAFEPQHATGLVVSARKAGYARALRMVWFDPRDTAQVNLVLRRGIESVIKVTDQAGQPVAGAAVRQYRQVGPDGKLVFFCVAAWQKALELSLPDSDTEGRIILPPLPSGDVLQDITIEHPRLVPGEIEKLEVAQGAMAEVSLRSGVVLTLHASGDNPKRLGPAYLMMSQWRPENFLRHRDRMIDFDAKGNARLAIDPGSYWNLFVDHDQYYVIPAPGSPLVLPDGFRENLTRIGQEQNDELEFEVHRKVPVRGRFVDAANGNGADDVVARCGIIRRVAPADTAAGKETALPERWRCLDRASSDAEGKFELPMAAGPARLWIHGGGRWIPEFAHVDLDVAEDGSTTVPDIRVWPRPEKIAGIVRKPDGTPAPGMAVVLRGKWFDAPPTLTDDGGRFEVALGDYDAEPYWYERAPHPSVVAFDPTGPLAGSVDLPLDRPNDVELKTSRHPAGWLLATYRAELDGWGLGLGATADKQQPTANAPTFDGAAWLNTAGETPQTAILRGKYVLLVLADCYRGDCHAELTVAQQAYALLKDRGLIVIGVQQAGAEPEGVDAMAKEEGWKFPIVIDQADRRIFTQCGIDAARFEGNLPNYVLIGPDGRVLLNDTALAHPRLRLYKLEILRQYLPTRTPGKASGKQQSAKEPEGK